MHSKSTRGFDRRTFEINMELYFITGNKISLRKLNPFSAKPSSWTLIYLKSKTLIPRSSFKQKYFEAPDHKDGEFIVDNISLYFDCLNGLLEPLIKWFLKNIGNDSLANLAEMTAKEKNGIIMRKIAVEKLKDFLSKR